MTWKHLSKVGVIGAGSFGTAIANVLAENQPVLLYVRNVEKMKVIEDARECKGQKLNDHITLTNDLPSFFEECILIYPMVDSQNFREMCKSMRPYLRPDHVLIHGTKGLSVNPPEGYETMENPTLKREHIHTMTEVIRQETNVLRVGSLSGPNLSKELAAKKPAATVIASRFSEVIELGKLSLKNNRFRVYGSHDVLGVELAGVLKNIMAIASGISTGLDMGENARAMLLTRGLGEMIRLTKALGSDAKAFFGMAGIGDLMATCASSKSRNYTIGFLLAQGNTLTESIEILNDTAEGIRTTQTAYALCQNYKVRAPIISAMYDILYKDSNIPETLGALMSLESNEDVDFL